jgi:membrane-bound lytic murein transglycosylase A
MIIRKIVCLVLACLFLGGCASWRRKDYSRPLEAGQVALRKITDPARIPDFRPAFRNRARLAASIDNSLFYFTHPSSQRYFPYLDISHSRAVHSLEKFKSLLKSASTPDELHRRIVDDFDVYESVGCDGKGTVLFTGYCTPFYDASREPTAEFRYPLYRQPPDLVKTKDGEILGRRVTARTIAPYYTRGEIERGSKLDGLELVYLKDRLEAFLVHVQGSAKLKLRDGSTLEVGYAAKNGRAYRSLGKMLADAGKLRRDRVSLTTIKSYFRKHPEDLDVFLPQNKSFVFFRETKGGPYGSLGVPVTAYRSIATDKRKDALGQEIYPRGGLAFIQTTLPAPALGGGITKQSYSGFILDQDTGGAIRSAGRADVYLGEGPEAETLAGHTVAEGRIYYLFAKTALLQRSL